MTEPDIVLHGRTVVLRRFGTADLSQEYIGWLNDPLVTRFSNQRFMSHDAATCSAYLASFDDGPNSFFSMRNLEDDRPIGTMTVYRQLPHGTADIGIMIGARWAWGQGRGQDAWDTLLGYLLGRGDVRKATGGALRCNLAMIRIMESAGMILEGLRKNQEIVAGEPEDVLYYGKFAA